MTSHHGTHNDLHSEQGVLPGEHPGRAKNPVIKVLDLAWLEFCKPDLAASERFAHAFGFATEGCWPVRCHMRQLPLGADHASRHSCSVSRVKADTCRTRLGRCAGRVRSRANPDSAKSLTELLRGPILMVSSVLYNAISTLAAGRINAVR
jgi:hypothetical protein